MVILFCILFTILNFSLATHANEFNCTHPDLHACLKHFHPPKSISRLILNPQITYNLSQSFEFPVGKHSIVITSESSVNVNIEWEKVHLVSLNAGVVSLENISFIGDSNAEFKKFHSFFTINNSMSVDIKRCRFQGLTGLALEIHSVNSGDFNLSISNSTFNGTGTPFRPSQGVYVRLHSTGNVSVSVTHSNFTNFKTNESSKLSYNQRIKFRPLAIEQSDNQGNKNTVKTFNVSYCDFENNEAYVGGGLGLYTTYASHSYYNVSHCNFRNNKVISNRLNDVEYDDKHSVEVIGSGGGIAGLFFNCDTCNLTIINCTLFGNTAVLGGGIKIGYYFESPDLFINVYECSFRNNIANSGSGLYIESQLIRHSIPRPAWLRNLNFSSNTATGFGAGIFVAYLPLMLKGEYIRFFNNVNTSFAVISSQIEVYANLEFKNNFGQRGGALFLSDNSQLLLNESVSLYFENNHAMEMGGAIYADSISLDLLYRDYGYTFYNVHCFIKHFIKFNPVTPKDYTQNITFKNNTALKGAAIYTHTLSPCSWYSDEAPYSNITFALRWETYSYLDDAGNPPNYPNLIATAVAHYTISEHNATVQKMLNYYNKPYKHRPAVNITVQPGIPTPIYFVATDQLGSHEVSIATVQSEAKSKVKPCNVHGDDSIFLTSSNDKGSNNRDRIELTFCGEPGDSGTVIFKSLDGLTIEKKVNVILESCPEGMFLNKSKLKCECYQLTPTAGITTYREEFDAHSVIYPWMKNSTGKTFVQMSCPNSYCNVTQQLIYEKQLQHCRVNVSNSSVCLKDRTGIGCTECSRNRDGLYSGTLRCGKCSPKRTTLSTVGVILLLFIIISFLFLVRASSYLNDHIEIRTKLGPYARAFIFFCQGLFLLYLNVTPDSPNGYHTLNSFSQFVSKTAFFFTYDQCFTLGFTSSRGIVFEEYFLYLIGYLSIFLITIFFNYILSRCISIKLKPSVLLFVLVVYSYLTYAPISFTTLRLISCGKINLYSSSTGQYTGTHFIWFYNATQTCMGTNWDIAITSVAFLVLIFYVIPLPLIFIGFSLVVKQLEIRLLFRKYYSKTKVIRLNKQIPLTHSKFKRLREFVMKVSSEYVGCFSDPHYGFWIPITMIAHFLLLLIQTNGALLSLTNDKQSQFLAVICFFFLYIRVSLKITKDPYVQFYESISIFCLCLACIFLIINDNLSNTNQPSGEHTFQSLVEYFPLVSYIIMFFSILTPPAIKYCVNKYNPATPDTEDTPKDIPPSPRSYPPANDWDSDEVDEQTKPLIANDPLNEINEFINNSTQRASPQARHINMGSSHSSTYSDHSHGTGTPGISDVDMRSMELSNANQADY